MDTIDAIEAVSQLKMLWSSALWLVCAARGCTVGEAHAAPHSAQLEQLLHELLRECDRCTAKPNPNSDPEPNKLLRKV